MNCKTIFLVATLVSFKGITMENTYFTWAAFSKNYNDEINSADSVYFSMESNGLTPYSMLAFDFHFLSDSKAKLNNLALLLKNSYGYKVLEPVKTENGVWDLSGKTSPFPVTADNLVYWTLDMYKRGYEFDAKFDGFGAPFDKNNQFFPPFEATTADEFFNKGFDYYNQGNLSAAIAQWTNTLKVNSKDVDALYSRAIAKNELYASNAAMIDYDKAIEIAPNFSSALLNRGALKDDNGDHLGAIADYGTVIEIIPKDEITLQRAYANMANSFKALGDLKAACQNWKKAKELGADYVNALLAEYCKS